MGDLMRITQACVELVKQFEGCRLGAYVCPAGVLTIGYGHTSAAGEPAVTEGMWINQARADQILGADLRNFADGVQDLVNVDLQPNQFDALVSFAFNVGIGALGKSTLLKRVNEGRFDAVPAEFMKWTKGRVNGQLVDLPGLVRRRRAEAALWRGVDDSAPVDPDESRATPETPVPSKTILTSKEAGGAVVAGGSATIAVANEVGNQMEQAGGLLHALGALVGKPQFWAFLIIILAAAAIWFWRRRRLREEAN